MKRIHTEIEIESSPERVWEVLTSFAELADWNPFMRSAEGKLKEGARLTLRLQPPSGMGMTFKPTVLKAESGRELRWIGRFMMPGLMDGEHFFTIEPEGEGRVRLSRARDLPACWCPC